MPDLNPILVVVDNLRQFDVFCRDLGLSSHDKKRMRGVTHPEAVAGVSNQHSFVVPYHLKFTSAASKAEQHLIDRGCSLWKPNGDDFKANTFTDWQMWYHSIPAGDWMLTQVCLARSNVALISYGWQLFSGEGTLSDQLGTIALLSLETGGLTHYTGFIEPAPKISLSVSWCDFGVECYDVLRVDDIKGRQEWNELIKVTSLVDHERRMCPVVAATARRVIA